MTHNYREVCEGYVFTRVCLSTGREDLGRYPPRQVHPLGRYTPWCMLGDTGNKRAVRILLECILVICILQFRIQQHHKLHRTYLFPLFMANKGERLF